MKITYDEKTDAIYIRLLDGKYECRNLQLSDDVTLNIGKEEELVGIEILDATKNIGDGKIPSLILENMPYSIESIVQK